MNLNLSGGIAIDTSGNVALYSAPGAGGGVGGDAGAGIQVAVSDAATVSDLGGWFTNASVSGGDGVNGSVDAFAGTSANGPVVGSGITIGVGAGADASLTRTDTKLTPLNYTPPPATPPPSTNPPPLGSNQHKGCGGAS